MLRIYADALYLPRRQTGGVAAKRSIAFCAEDCRGREDSADTQRQGAESIGGSLSTCNKEDAICMERKIELVEISDTQWRKNIDNMKRLISEVINNKLKTSI